MSEQPPKQEEVVTVPPKKSKKSNKTILIVIGVIVGLMIIGSLAAVAVGWFAFKKAGDSISSVVEQANEEMANADDKDDYDRFAADDVDQTDEHGGRIYATKHGLPDGFPSQVTIVEPSQLKQITSQAKAKGEEPVRWRVISESGFSTVEETKAAIEKAYQGFGEKVDRTEAPGAEQFAKDSVMLSYTNAEYRVNMIAAQETEYQKGPVGNFLITYDIEVR